MIKTCLHTDRRGKGVTDVNIEDEPGWHRVRQAVRSELSGRGWNSYTLAQEANVDPGTIRRLMQLRGGPLKLPTLGKIEKVFEWEPGYLSALASGEAEPPIPLQDAEAIDNDTEILRMIVIPDHLIEGLTYAQILRVHVGALNRAIEIAHELQASNDSRKRLGAANERTDHGQETP